MTDIDHAAILRQHADTRRRGHSVNPDVLRAAADEIERLRAELKEMKERAERESHSATRFAKRNAALVAEIDLLMEAKRKREANLRRAMYEGEG